MRRSGRLSSTRLLRIVWTLIQGIGQRLPCYSSISSSPRIRVDNAYWQSWSNTPSLISKNSDEGKSRKGRKAHSKTSCICWTVPNQVPRPSSTTKTIHNAVEKAETSGTAKSYARSNPATALIPRWSSTKIKVRWSSTIIVWSSTRIRKNHQHSWTSTSVGWGVMRIRWSSRNSNSSRGLRIMMIPALPRFSRFIWSIRRSSRSCWLTD